MNEISHSPNNNLEIAKLLFEKTGEELNRSWTRNNLLVTINVGLLAVFATAIDKLSTPLTLIFSLLGISASLTWFQVNRVGKYYSERWRQDGINFLATIKDPNLRDIFKTGSGIPTIKRPWGPKASTCMKFLALAISSLWLVIILALIFKKDILKASSAKSRNRTMKIDFVNEASPRIAVFGGTSAKPEDSNYQAAIAIGKLVAKSGAVIINGGYGGIHEASAIGAKDAGGKSIGVTLDLVIDNVNKRIGNPYISETIVASSYGERFEVLMNSNGFIIIAGGGEGTAFELFGFLNFNRKRWKFQKKLAILKPVDYSKSGWDREMFEQLISFGVIHPSNIEEVLFTRSEKEAVDWVLPK